jgi:hypothetical protein
MTTTPEYIGKTEEVVSQQEKHVIYYRSDASHEEDVFRRVRNSLWMRVTESGNAVVSESNNVLKQVIHFLRIISEVKAIYLMRDADSSIQIWTLADPLDDEVLDSIFDQELKVIQYFKDSIAFDFHVTPLSDENFLKGQGSMLIYRRG